jgi:hypothetical protein
MGLEIQMANLTANQTKTFNFSGNVMQRVAGFNAFSLTFGSTDHHVKTTQIQLLVSQSGSEVTVQAVAVMKDGSGHNLTGSSTVSVVVMAYVGVNDDNLVIANVGGSIPNGGVSAPLAIPSPNPISLKALISGFDLSYSGSDHHVEKIAAGVGASQSGATASITGVAEMMDASGNNADTANVCGGLIANNDYSMGMQIRSTDNLQGGTQLLNFNAGTSHYYPFMTGFNVSFGDHTDHHVKTFSSNITISSTSGTNVTVTGGAYLSDGSGNNQNNSISHATGFVVGF